MLWFERLKIQLRKHKWFLDQPETQAVTNPSASFATLQFNKPLSPIPPAPLPPSQPVQLVPATTPANRSNADIGTLTGEDLRANPPTATSPNPSQSQPYHAPAHSPASVPIPSHNSTTSYSPLPSNPSSTNATLLVDGRLANAASSTHDGAPVSHQFH
jgi:hypothetical protein